MMRDRDQRIYDEAAALWRELFGETPPVRLDGTALLDAITKGLPETRYERLASPHLRASQITGPRGGNRAEAA